MYTRVLTPLDGSDPSEQVLPFARAMASGLSLPMTLLMTIDTWHPSIGYYLNPELHSHETEAHHLSHAEGYLSSVTARMRGAGVAAESLVLRGDPAAAIVDEAASDPSTLIAMASHGRSGMARWWMGSVADKVLHMAVNPLLIVRSLPHPEATQARTPDGLIVPLDGSEVAEEVLTHVVFMAKSLGIPVELLQVTISEVEYYQAMSMGLRVLPPKLPSFQSLSERIEGDAKAYLHNVRDRILQEGVATVGTRLVQGSPAERICDLASAYWNYLVAMTTHGRSGVGRMILGSVAERVVRHSGGPVLLVRSSHGHQTSMTGAPSQA